MSMFDKDFSVGVNHVPNQHLSRKQEENWNYTRETMLAGTKGNKVEGNEGRL